MGRTPKPLKFLLLDPSMAEWDEFRALAAQGHTVAVSSGPGTVGSVGQYGDYDVILGPRAWYFTTDSRPFFDLMLKAVRKRAYPKGGAE